MKTITRIAKAELLTLFYSPIAWFLMIVFLVQCAVVYVGQLESYARTQELSGTLPSYLGYLTEAVYLGGRGLFNSVMQNLYLYIPLLTMSLISRETSSGTIKLLYSSPINVREIVLGKFLAMMAYSLVLVLVVAIFLFSGLFHIQSPDTGMMLTAILGFYLLLCAYSAIGLFMSCLTTYQVVAAVSTFVMIGILSYIGSLWQGIAFVRELTYFLSIKGRTNNMLAGLVTSKDVIYFLVIIYMFLGLSVYKLKAGMESKSALVRTARYVSVLAFTLVIGYISSIPGMIGYYDATANQLRTLTPNAQKILKELGDDPLEITVYNNLLSRYWYLGAPRAFNDNLARWEPYRRFKTNIEINTVLYYDEPLDNSYLMKGYPGKTVRQVAEQYAKAIRIDLSDFKKPKEAQKMADLKSEMNRYVMELKWKGKKTFLRVFDDQIVWPTETEVSAAIKRLLQAKLPKVGFLSGNMERDVNKMGDKDYKALANMSTFRYSLINQGFDVDSISLETQSIPDNISTLVIADPKIAMSKADMAKLESYIDKGGNILIAGEPGRQAILNPLLNRIGVQIMDGMIVQESKDYSPDLISPQLTPYAGTFYKELMGTVTDSIPVSMPSAAGLDYRNAAGFKVTPLLKTNDRVSWNKKVKLDLDRFNRASFSGKITESNRPTTDAEGKPVAAGVVLFSGAEGDLKGSFATAIAMSRMLNGKEQRIVVTSDADFLSNSELQRTNITTSNFFFSTGIFSWLSYQQFPIDTSRPPSKDKMLTVTLDQVDLLRILYVWILPGILVVFSSILLLRRKRK